MKLVECVPNFSEGRRLDVVHSIQAAALEVPGVAALDLHLDAAHNRMVLTLAGPAEAVAESAVRAAARAAELIDLRAHRGEHPRMGATDVVPFVPLGETTMDECVILARSVARRLGEELGIPVYLYARAATRPQRRPLSFIRNRGYERLQREIGAHPELEPDFGPRELGPAGATAVGARPLLVAFNVNLASADLGIARQIARAVRESSGGLPAVQARGMVTPDPGVVQVSMNLLDVEVTPVHVAFERVREEAESRAVAVLESELVGLAPVRALAQTMRHYLKAPRLLADQAIEARLLARLLEKR
jgi:glutamate formiminotransferase